MSKTILPERLLKEAVKKACEMENLIYDEIIMQEEKHIFSDEFQRKMQALITRNRF